LKGCDIFNYMHWPKRLFNEKWYLYNDFLTTFEIIFFSHTYIMFLFSIFVALKTKTKKRQRSKNLGPEAQSNMPRAWKSITMRLGHGLMPTCAYRAWQRCNMRLKHIACASSMLKSGGPNVISFVFVGKARVFSPNPVWNLHYKY